MNLDNYITLREIKKDFYFNKTKISILKGINLDINKGEFIVIMGPSGSGKSTLLNIVGLLDSTSSGEFIWENEKIFNLNQNQLSDKRTNDIGFVFQQYNLIKSLSVKENVLLPLYLNNKLTDAEKIKKVNDVLGKVGMIHRKDNFPNTLSGGEQQRVAIARSLVNDPSLIIADEPTGNVDQENENAIINILTELANEGKAILVVTHNEIYKRVASKLYYLKDGILIEGGKTV
ncbi:putative ABC transport system ATP-binding protein [Clostridium sp. USBA 49]|uniref:ABC transporter ATP-binding protein n=1 Tax=Clostridium sp. USBA 49 TaxID=1881060 RepID=UPI000999E83F|nr:ABC transporter ATP-binding protein [Clostridium sp. USBA 49]SKA92161.1 putative ABC transport system ATP-binding protein [Clostridium sp. USBA 49]